MISLESEIMSNSYDPPGLLDGLGCWQSGCWPGYKPVLHRRTGYCFEGLGRETVGAGAQRADLSGDESGRAVTQPEAGRWVAVSACTNRRASVSCRERTRG
jgi:hypothetical protein